MKAALKDAIENIKKAGFSHIKVELEGDIGRDGGMDCSNCDATGYEDCENCEGRGYVELEDNNGNDYSPECAECYGDCHTTCGNCDGEGTEGNYRDESDCEHFMRQYVGDEVNDRLTYGNFYEDGSVDSEFTFTLPLDHVEDVLVWMDAFKALADECGRLNVSGAGLHITVLPRESNGYYPVESSTLDSRGVRNFKSEMTKLLPALFFLASSGHQSRDLGYRHAKIDDDKYNAISTHDNSCFEFRVFETCYDRPEAFYDYVETIANSLKFYANPDLKVSALGKKFGFNNGNEVARFYNTPEQLRILNSTVKHLKPSKKSFKKLKQERGVQYTIKGLMTKEKLRIAEIREDYKRYRQHYLEVKATPLTERQQRELAYYIEDRGENRQEAEYMVRGISRRVMTITEFIQTQLSGQQNYQETVTV